MFLPLVAIVSFIVGACMGALGYSFDTPQWWLAMTFAYLMTLAATK